MQPKKTYILSVARLQTGFTLVEVLVVLVMVSLMTGILFQALHRTNQLQLRSGQELYKVQELHMLEDWYRQTLQGISADYPDGDNQFKGTEQQFSGLSHNPLGTDYGAPTPIQWQLQEQPSKGTIQLIYSSNQTQSMLLEWKADRAYFSYVDDTMQVHKQWPPPLGLYPQLPKQVHLTTRYLGQDKVIVASPMGPTTPRLRAQDLFGVP